MRPKVCLDVMGADVRPAVIIQGGLEALGQDEDLEIILFGQKNLIEEELATFSQPKEGRITVIDCPEFFSMNDRSLKPYKDKPQSSIVEGLRQTKLGLELAFLSFGNTGIVVAAAYHLIKRIKGVKFPGLAQQLPNLQNLNKSSILIDLGANSQCDDSHLLCFVQLGWLLSRFLGLDEPKVALLSIGEELGKGNQLIQRSSEKLALESRWKLFGNGLVDRIFTQGADVIVGDGFSVNIALKAVEDTVRSFKMEFAQIFQQLLTNHPEKQEFIANSLALEMKKVFATRWNPSRYGAAYLLGLQSVVMIGHGSTDSEAVKWGVLQAAQAVRNDLVGYINRHWS
jgi:glycerol-3-phosphate acyltransferase PlsX